MAREYEAKIVQCNKELTAKQRISLKDTGDAIRLDEATQEAVVIIYPDIIAEIGVHNEKSENKDYSNYVIVDKQGNKYVTSSQSFWRQLSDIADEMLDEDNEEWGIKVYRKESKNYKGKEFITCSIV